MPSREIDVRRPAGPRPPGRRPLPGPGVVVPKQERARPLASWAGLDPTGVASGVVRVAYALPGVAAFEQAFVVPLERRFLDLVVERAGLAQPAAEPATRTPPRRRLADLVDDALDQTPDQGRADLYTAVLDRLVPDEVRILAALADGRAFAAVDVTAGRNGTVLLRYASTVGRAADVVLPERTPVYVAALEQAGLVRIGPADVTLRDEYERLLADPQVRTARAEAAAARRFGRARIERRTVRISDFGRELWDANRPTRATRRR